MRTTIVGGALAVLLLVGTGAWAENPPADDAVVKTYRQAVRVDSQDVVAHYNLGLSLYRIGNYEEALRILEHTVSLNSGDREAHRQVDGPAWQLIGIIYYTRRQDDHRSIDAFRRSLEALPGDSETEYFLGLALLRRKDYTAAQQSFQQAIAHGRDRDASLYFQLGRALAETQKIDEAVAAYVKAVELKPDYQEALENLALLYHHAKQDESAVPVLKKLLALEPMNFNANYLLGLYYYRQKMYQEMVTAFTHVVAVKPDLADAYYNLGVAYYYQTRYDQAVESLKKAVALNPKDTEAYNLLGQAQIAAVETHLQEGSNLIAQERYAEAARELRNVLVVDPEHHKARVLLEDVEHKITEETTAHLSLARKFYREGRLEEAYNEYELALKLAPDNAEAEQGVRTTQLQLGQVLARRLKKARSAENLGDFAESRRQYQAILKLKPGYAEAVSGLRNLERLLARKIDQTRSLADKLAKEGRLPAAAKAYKTLLNLTDTSGDKAAQEKALSGLSRVNAQIAELIQQSLDQGKQDVAAGDKTKAKAQFNRVLELDPQNRAANDYIMKLTGSQSQAKVTAELIKSTYYQGVDYYVKGKIEEAIQEWQKVVRLDPENQDARINIERARAKLAAIRKLTEGQ